jgi:ATP-dependent DNA helicase RecQ
LKPAAAKRGGRGGGGAAPGHSWEGVDRGLFDALRELRSGIAAEQGVPPYVVFGDAALRDMARRRPSTADAFLQVRGVGEHKRQQYGRAFVEAIVAYSADRGLPLDVEFEPAPDVAHSAAEEAAGPKAASIPAFAYFRRGAPIDEVMQKLGRARSTVLSYLNDYLRFERVIDPGPWIDAPLARRIEDALAAVGPGRLKPVFDHLGGAVSYDDIRIVATCVANREAC